MRKLIFAALLASVVTAPALAQDQNDHRQHKEQKQQQRPNGNNNRPQPQANRQQQMPPQANRPQQMPPQEGQRGNFQRPPGPGIAVPPQGGQQQANRGYRGGYNGQVQQAPHQVENYNGQRGYYGQGQQVQPYYGQGGRYAYGHGGTWNQNWRNDQRYDWRRYRDSHRSVFHIGIYYDPFGYGYQPFNIGYRLAPVYFSQQYWIDPAMYMLPYPPPGTQWVRYWNDAVLVDMYTGQVVDVIHGFFW